MRTESLLLLSIVVICAITTIFAAPKHKKPSEVKILKGCGRDKWGVFRRGVFADGRDCHRYVHCWKGTSYYFRCYDGFVFNPCKRRCVFQDKCIKPQLCRQKVGFLFLPGQDTISQQTEALLDNTPEEKEEAFVDPEDADESVFVSEDEDIEIIEKQVQVPSPKLSQDNVVNEVPAVTNAPVDPTTTMMTYVVRVVFGRNSEPEVKVSLPELSGHNRHAHVKLAKQDNALVVEEGKEESAKQVTVPLNASPSTLAPTTAAAVEEEEATTTVAQAVEEETTTATEAPLVTEKAEVESTETTAFPEDLEQKSTTFPPIVGEEDEAEEKPAEEEEKLESTTLSASPLEGELLAGEKNSEGSDLLLGGEKSEGEGEDEEGLAPLKDEALPAGSDQEILDGEQVPIEGEVPEVPLAEKKEGEEVKPVEVEESGPVDELKEVDPLPAVGEEKPEEVPLESVDELPAKSAAQLGEEFIAAGDEALEPAEGDEELLEGSGEGDVELEQEAEVPAEEEEELLPAAPAEEAPVEAVEDDGAAPLDDEVNLGGEEEAVGDEQVPLGGEGAEEQVAEEVAKAESELELTPEEELEAAEELAQEEAELLKGEEELLGGDADEILPEEALVDPLLKPEEEALVDPLFKPEEEALVDPLFPAESQVKDENPQTEELESLETVAPAVVEGEESLGEDAGLDLGEGEEVELKPEEVDEGLKEKIEEALEKKGEELEESAKELEEQLEEVKAKQEAILVAENELKSANLGDAVKEEEEEGSVEEGSEGLIEEGSELSLGEDSESSAGLPIGQEEELDSGLSSEQEEESDSGLLLGEEKEESGSDLPLEEEQEGSEGEEFLVEEGEEKLEKPAEEEGPEVVKLEKIPEEVAAVESVNVEEAVAGDTEQLVDESQPTEIQLIPQAQPLNNVDDVVVVDSEHPLPHMCKISGASQEAVCSCPNKEIESKMSASELLRHCESLNCLNGGMYMTLSSGHCGCVCPLGYKGESCQHLADQSQCHCANGGSCVPLAGGNFACRCPIGFFGGQCQYEIDAIQPRAANLRHSPISFLNKALKYTQEQKTLSLCGQSNRCLNGGMCMEETTGDRECFCPNHYTGQFCGQDVRRILS